MEEYQYINSILFQFYENLLEKTGREISFFFFFWSMNILPWILIVDH